MNRSKKRLARLCSVVVLAVTVPAEETLWCRSLGVDQGLSQSFITAIAQDRDGFLWFGTLSGLNRWDGYQFESFAHFHEDSASLSDSAVFALHFDRNGRLWVGTDKGIDGYVPTTSAFQRYGTGFRMPDGRTPLRVEGIASDSAGRVWYASFAGPRLYRADPQSGRESEQLIPGLPRGEVSALYVDRADRLWVAAQPQRAEPEAEAAAPVVFVFDRCGEIGEGPLPAPRRPFTLEVEGGRVAVILEDAAGRLWLGRRGGGLLRFDPRAGDATGADSLRRLAVDAANPAALADGNVRSLAISPAGDIWVLTDPVGPGFGGVHRVDAESLVARRVTLRQEAPRAAGDASLEELAVDHSGVLWLGTNAGGLRYADIAAGGFALYRQGLAGIPGLDSRYVRAICQGRDGLLWVGSPEGLNRLDRSGPGIVYTSSSSSPGWFELPHPNVQAICEDRQGNLWVGTAGGLAVLDRASGVIHGYQADPNPDSLSDNYVQVIHEGPAGRLWIGTLGHGLNEFEPETQTFKHYPADPDDPASLPSGTVHALYTGRQGRLWIGTSAGLASLDPASSPPPRFHRIAPLAGDTVLAIGESMATPDTLWVGTAQRGLGRLDWRGGTCRFYTSQNSMLPDNTIYGVLSDRRGRLWLSTNRGLVCYDPTRESFHRYDIDRGLQSSEFNARAYFQAPDGEMFFGGVNGLNSFYPERITDNPHPPRVAITEVLLTDRGAKRPDLAAASVYRHGMPRRPLWIEHRQRDVGFRFVALHYGDASQNRCDYRLDPYDTDWHEQPAQRQTRYTNLDPGRYTFRVRAISSHGVPSEDEATFAFVILPPFYATAWFRGSLGLGVCLALIGTHQLRVRTLRRRQEKLEVEVAHRTEELQRALGKLREALVTVEGQAQKLQELDSAKSKFFTNISHEFRTPLMLTLGPLRDVLAGSHGAVPPKARAAVELATRNTGRQLELVEQLLMLARLDAGQLKFQPRALRLDALLRRAVAPYESVAERQQVRFTLALPDGPVEGQFDEGQLEQVIGNLVGNAFKFTPPGGAVCLRLTATTTGWALMEVEDTGPGISAQDLPHIFERFYRGEPSAGQRPGTGIGLAVAKECVEMHGGEISAENRAEGGARFTVRLPTTPRPASD